MGILTDLTCVIVLSYLKRTFLALFIPLTSSTKFITQHQALKNRKKRVYLDVFNRERSNNDYVDPVV